MGAKSEGGGGDPQAAAMTFTVTETQLLPPRRL